MGSYTEIFINNKEIYGFKNNINPDFTEKLFRAEDQIECSIKLSDQVGYVNNKGNDPNEIIKVNYVKSNIGDLKDRLNLLGYSKKSYEEDFIKFKEYKISELEENLLQTDDLKYTNVEDFTVHQLATRELDFWKKVKLSKFIDASTKIINERIEWEEFNFGDMDKFANYVNYLHYTDAYLIDSMPFFDELNAFAAIIEHLSNDQIVIQDLSHLISGGWIDETFRINEFNDKIIIITEGSSDINILKPSLKFLYPHLYEYYSFMDFKSFKTQGSANSLLQTIKAFASAGIKNKTIALFDNDTAARDVLSTINIESFPSNFKILKFPELEIAKNYPTLGPSGQVGMDINGLACSIEIFTGSDVLNNGNGSYYPIQWKGYNKKLNSYQGEILEKKKVQEKFQQKLEQTKTNRKQIQDWSGIRKIYEMIFNAYN